MFPSRSVARLDPNPRGRNTLSIANFITLTLGSAWRCRSLKAKVRTLDGRFRGAAQTEFSPRHERARWVAAEARHLRDRGWEYERIAQHLTEVGRQSAAPYLQIPCALTFRYEYCISAAAVWKACNPNRKRKPRPFLDKKLEYLRLEDLIFCLGPRIQQGDIPAIGAALKIMRREAQVLGYRPDKRRRPS